jgi:hypothetical protein
MEKTVSLLSEIEHKFCYLLRANKKIRDSEEGEISDAQEILDSLKRNEGSE